MQCSSFPLSVLVSLLLLPCNSGNFNTCVRNAAPFRQKQKHTSPKHQKSKTLPLVIRLRIEKALDFNYKNLMWPTSLSCFPHLFIRTVKEHSPYLFVFWLKLRHLFTGLSGRLQTMFTVITVPFENCLTYTSLHLMCNKLNCLGEAPLTNLNVTMISLYFCRDPRAKKWHPDLVVILLRSLSTTRHELCS